MKYEVNWAFPITGGGKKTGFNEAGIQFFNDDILLSLAREMCQNSLDAKREGSDGPVTVAFNSKDFVLLSILPVSVQGSQNVNSSPKNSASGISKLSFSSSLPNSSFIMSDRFISIIT